MKTLSKREAIDLMNSDMKLWDAATTVDNGKGTLVKSLDLPFGIGETNVTIEGLTDAGKKRNAVSQFGEYIRGLIKERIDDEAVTARAKAAAQKAEQDDSSDSLRDGSERVQDTRRKAPTYPPAVEAHEEDVAEDAGLGATLAARRASLVERIGRVETNLTLWRKELRGIDAALEAMSDDG